MSTQNNVIDIRTRIALPTPIELKENQRKVARELEYLARQIRLGNVEYVVTTWEGPGHELRVEGKGRGL